MEKYSIIFTAITAVLLVSCQELPERIEEQDCELRFTESVEPFTKGVVEGTSLTDNVTGDRPMYITAYLHPQYGKEENYLINEPFTKSSGEWKHIPAVYWPLEARMDMLAYSSATPFPVEDIIFGQPNNAERMIIAVGNDRIHDDILYGAKWNSLKPGEGATTMSMKHTQAQIVFQVSKDSETTEPCTLEKIVLKDIYLEGDLTIENNHGAPDHSWSFRRASARDYIMEDSNSIYGTNLSSSTETFSVLIPEQEMKSIEFHYTIAGGSKKIKKDLPHQNWLGGSKYVYAVQIKRPKSIDGHEYVDLGLRRDGNMILFAKMNIGANSPEEYGDYFAWGETSKRYTSISGSTITGGTFNWNNAPFHTGTDENVGWTKYIPNGKDSYWDGDGSTDNKTTLDLSDDVARALWGGGWRMPDKADLQYLISSNVTYEWVTNWESTGINGYLIRGKGDFSSASLFLPAAGYCVGGSRYHAGAYGYYWSRSLHVSTPQGAWRLGFYSGSRSVGGDHRRCGCSVRPVLAVPL